MCCQRCIEAVTYELQFLGLTIGSVKLGTASYAPSDKVTLSQVETILNKRGLVLIKDEEEILVEKIKTVTLDLVHHLFEIEKANLVLSAYLEELSPGRNENSLTGYNYYPTSAPVNQTRQIIAALLAAYMLSLVLMPCNDTCDSEQYQTPPTIQSAQEHHELASRTNQR